MDENKRDIFLHDWVIDEIQYQYSKEFNEIKINKYDSKDNIFEGMYPDIIFGNYGEIVMIGEVETVLEPLESIISHWKELQKTNISLIIFVPKDKLKEARDICWNNQLIERVKVSTFSVEIPIS